jgi:hypothetical protein
MGVKMSVEEKAAVKKSRAIDKELAKARSDMAKEVKLLLLGTGGSGKSTIAKQMHIIYLNGFKDKEREEYKNLIVVNLAENMQALILGARKLELEFSSKEHEALVDEVMAWDIDDLEWTPQHLEKVKVLWREEPTISKAYDRQSEFQLSDSAK